jgi:NAD-dependent dihydropyrimidine dehydrogenase PreA subunit
VWCAAGGGRFTIESIISIIKTSRIAELVDHRRLILPELCASGINMFDLKRRTGWVGVFGPVEASSIPQFLQTRRKTEAMTRITFTIKERLEMAVAMWGSLSLRFTLFPGLIFGWRASLWFILVVALLSLGVSLGCFILPGKTFVQRAGFLGLLGILLTLGGLIYMQQATPFEVSKWIALIGFASFLTGTSFPSYSPYWPCGYSKLFYGSCDLELTVIEEQCIGCKICDQVCPVECFALTEQRKMTFVNPEVCIGCGACLIQCPTNAIINEVAEDHLRQVVCG